MWSINERLYALLPAGSDAGHTVAPLSLEWLTDLHAVNALELEEAEDREDGKNPYEREFDESDIRGM